jgi:hypothetical protein
MSQTGTISYHELPGQRPRIEGAGEDVVAERLGVLAIAEQNVERSYRGLRVPIPAEAGIAPED